MLHAVLRADKYTGENVAWLRRDVFRPMGIVAVANNTNDCKCFDCYKIVLFHSNLSLFIFDKVLVIHVVYLMGAVKIYVA